MAKPDVTKLVRASKRSDSLKTTVPAFITRLLELEVGDELEWVHQLEAGEALVKIKKLKGRDD